MAQKGLTTTLSDTDIAGIISKEAAATMRDHVLANPDLIGSTVTLDVLGSPRPPASQDLAIALVGNPN